ncbi:thioredoxin [Engelhardtia mirabilis]|uniref:Thioredoxin n=1 Tax=Engelhardtia mirabilis TaxID=2528011 RepID=A0A518BLI0_9BACT|nr:Thioredoxin C-1 [Planctomycetes bacterium Pla133]QDV02153.1 Thioredoxin C-1 [Planctomycetes bacterium Pla86]
MPSASPHVVDVGVSNFALEVVERSKTVPVLVDFWAEWCGPCKTLGPILENLAVELNGAFVLAKVDTEKEQELAAAFQVQSIPTVVLVIDGRPADGFVGALPEAEIRRFLEPHVGPVEDPLEPARAALEAGDAAGAVAMLEGLFADRPDDDEVKLLLARAALEAGDSARAIGLLDALPPSVAEGAEARALRARLALAQEQAVDLTALAAAAQNEKDLDARIAYGRALASVGRVEEGLDLLLETIEIDREYNEQAARRAMVEVLDSLGSSSDLAHSYRRRLQMAMYV